MKTMESDEKEKRQAEEMAGAHMPRTAIERGVIAPAQLAHIVLRTARYKKVVSWYRTLLNAEPTFSNNRLTFLSYDEEHHRIAIANMPVLGRRNKSRPGVDHVAFTYRSIGELMENHARLRERGIRPAWAINHGPTTSMYYEDPDGNFVELQVENFDTPEDLAAWMSTGEFKENPVGVNFDPDDLLARYRAGEDEAELKRRPHIGRPDSSNVPKAYLGGWLYFLSTIARRLGIET